MKFIEREIFISIIQVSEKLQFEFNELFKPYGITHQQYNVLRILHGAGGQGLPTREVANRMINRMPDICRLIDRLKDKNLVKRRRLTKDRRIVRVMITEEGIELLANLEKMTNELHKQQLSHLTEDQKEILRRVLTAIKKE